MPSGLTLTGASELGQQHRTLSWEGHPQLRASTGTRAGQDGAIPGARGAVGAVSQCQPSLEPQPCWAQSPWEPMAGPAQQSGIGLIQQDTVAVAVPGALAGDLPLGVWSSLGLQGQERAGAGHGHHPSTATRPALVSQCHHCPVLPRAPAETGDPSAPALPWPRTPLCSLLPVLPDPGVLVSQEEGSVQPC